MRHKFENILGDELQLTQKEIGFKDDTKEIKYGLAEEKYFFEKEERISYGIVAYADSQTDGSASIIASFHDLSGDKSVLEKLVYDCNRLHLSLLHFSDTIQDFLAKN